MKSINGKTATSYDDLDENSMFIDPLTNKKVFLGQLDEIIQDFDEFESGNNGDGFEQDAFEYLNIDSVFCPEDSDSYLQAPSGVIKLQGENTNIAIIDTGVSANTWEYFRAQNPDLVVVFAQYNDYSNKPYGE